MLKNIIITLVLLFGIYQCAIAQQELNINDIDRRVYEIRSEPRLDLKIKYYEDFKTDPKWKNQDGFSIKCAMLEQMIALSYAEENDISNFKDWLAKINSAVWKSSTQQQGYKILSKYRRDASFKKEIAKILDPYLEIERPENKDISHFSSYLIIYLKQNKNVVNAKVKKYLDYLFDFHDGYFLSDFEYEKKGIPLEETMTLIYAKNLLEEGKKEQINTLLAKSILANNFQQSELDKISALLSSVDNLNESVTRLIIKHREGYQEQVHKLLANKTLFQGEKFKSGSHKYLVLDFWGSWCIPCRASHPKLIELYNKYHANGLEIISIAREAKSEGNQMSNIWKEAIKKDKMIWPQLLNNENEDVFDAIKVFSISVFPTKILFDSDYNLIGVYTGFEGTSKLEEKLKEFVY